MSPGKNLKSTGRSHPIAAVVMLVLIASVLAACSWSSNVNLVSEPVTQTLDGATRADVEIALAVGQLRIGALDQQSALITGEIAYPDRNSVTRDFAVRGDTASFSMREQDAFDQGGMKFNDKTPVWDLRLSSTTPLRLTLETGVGENVIDLAQLKLTELTLKSGVGTTLLTLPREGTMQAQVEGGIGKLTVRVPSGVGVRVQAQAGLGSTNIPDAYHQQGNTYVSPEYDTAAAHIDLNIQAGIGEITFEQIAD